MYGKLYLVSTPIGNLGDITFRALETLKSVDFIAAEDTRVTIKLLNHFGIKKPLVSYYNYNRKSSGEKISARLLAGENCALVTDAGTPAISDPGEDIVRLCAELGIGVIPVPGVSAAVTALSVSALPTGRFCFEGFLSTSRKSRTAHLESVKDEPRTMIFYEAPHKLLASLSDMLEVLGDRDVSVSRELTKLHEETLRCKLTEAIAHFTENAPRGEFVIILRGAEDDNSKKLAEPEEAIRRVEELREAGFSLREAAQIVSEETGFGKNELYGMALRGGE